MPSLFVHSNTNRRIRPSISFSGAVCVWLYRDATSDGTFLWQPTEPSSEPSGGDGRQEEREEEEEDEDQQLVSSLMTSQHTIDQKMEEAQLQLFSGQAPISSQDAAM